MRPTVSRKVSSPEPPERLTWVRRLRDTDCYAKNGVGRSAEATSSHCSPQERSV